jgi:hypothetical protein
MIPPQKNEKPQGKIEWTFGDMLMIFMIGFVVGMAVTDSVRHQQRDQFKASIVNYRPASR